MKLVTFHSIQKLRSKMFKISLLLILLSTAIGEGDITWNSQIMLLVALIGRRIKCSKFSPYYGIIILWN